MKMKDVNRFIGREDTIIVDLRNEDEYCSGHIPGALNIPYEQGENIAIYVQGYRYVLLYCHKGSVSLLAARDLHGVNAAVFSLCGGIRAYTGILERS